MHNISRHQGKLTNVKRLPSSKNGNPRFQAQVGGLTAKTSVDAMIAYAIKGFEGKEVTAEIGTHYGVATFNRIQTL